MQENEKIATPAVGTEEIGIESAIGLIVDEEITIEKEKGTGIGNGLPDVTETRIIMMIGREGMVETGTVSANVNVNVSNVNENENGIGIGIATVDENES